MPAQRTDFRIDIDRDADIGAAKTAILDARAHDSRVLKAPPAEIWIETMSGPQVVLNVHAWLANRDFIPTESEIKILVRRTLNEAGFGPPVPVPAPSVAPWIPPETPPAESKQDTQANRPN